MPQNTQLFGPKASGHFSVGKLCPACQVPFEIGDFTTLISLGPGADKEQQQLAREGKSFSAMAEEVHYQCATGVDPSEVVERTPESSL